MSKQAKRPLTQAEQAVIADAQTALAGVPSIPCTGCEYCLAGCPQNIPIPRIFSARNQQLIWGQTERGLASYQDAIQGKGKASDCIACGQCEAACPQRLSIIEYLKGCAGAME